MCQNWFSKGYKVAICEQMDDIPDGKGPTPREVVRVVTPGTAQLDPVLESTQANYLVAIHQERSMYGIAVVDATTGVFFCDICNDLTDVQNELVRLDAREVLVADACMDQIKHPSKNSFFPYEKTSGSPYFSSF